MGSHNEESTKDQRYSHFLRKFRNFDSNKAFQVDSIIWIAELFEIISQPAFLIDMSSGNLELVNKSFTENFQISKANVLGKSLVELGLWHSVESFGRSESENMQSGKNTYVNLKSRDGENYAFELMTNIINYNGRSCSICILAKEGGSSFRERLGGKLPDLMSVSMHGIFLIQDDKFIYFNGKFADTIGMTPEEIYKLSPGRVIEKLASPEYQNVTSLSYEEFKTSDAVEGNIELKIKTADGGDRWVEVHSQRFDYEGSPAILGVVNNITDRKTAAEKIKAGGKLINTILDSVQDSIFLKDSELKYVHVNKQMELLFDMPADKIIGLTDDELFDSEAAAHIRDVDTRVLGDEVVDEEHTKPVRGVAHTFHVIKSPIRDAAGKITGICGVARDITERKLSEKQLRKSQGHLKSIIENTNDIIISYLPDGTISYISPQVKRYGYDPQEIIGRKSYEFIHPDDIEGVARDLQNTLLTGREFPTSFRILAKDGGVYHMEERSRVVREGDKIVQLSGVIRDVTVQHKAEINLRQSEAKYRQLVETMNDGLGAVDAEGYVTFVNSSACRILGHSHAELIGHHISEFLDRENYDILAEQLRRRRSGERGNYELIWNGKDEAKIHTSMSSAPLYDKQNNFIGSFAVLTDLTEKKRIATELEQAHFDLNQIFQAATPMIVIDNNHTMIKINDTYQNTYNVKQEDIIGKKCYESYPGPLCNSTECPIEKIMSGMERYNYEDVSELSDGRKVYSLATALPYRNANGEIVGIVESFADISDRKRAEQALKESEEKFREIAELAPEGIYEMDLAGKITFANKKAFEYFGYTRDDFKKGFNSLDIISPEDKDRAAQNMGRVMAGEKLLANEYQVIRKDGTTFTASMHSSPIIRDGKPAGVRGIIIDVTERKKAEEALRASEMFNRAVIEKSPLGVSVRSKNGKLLSCNSAWQNIWGKTDEQIAEYLAEPERQRLRFDHRDEYLAPWHDEIVKIYKDSGYFYIPEVQLKYHREGGNRWVSQHFYALKGNDDNVDRVVILTEDITERKRTSEILRQSEKYYRGLFEGAHDAIFVLKPEGEIILDVNQRAREIYGFTKNELIGKSLEELTKDVDHGKKQIQQITQKEIHHSFESIHYNKDGSEMHLEINASLIDYKGQKAILSINRDITQKKKAETALQENEARFRTVLNSAPISIFAVDLQGNITFIEGRHFGLTGKSQKELVGQSIFELNLDLDVPRLFKSALTGKLDLYYIESAGKVFELRLSAQRDYSGNPTGLIGTATDITSRRKAEEALEKSESWLRTIVSESTLTLFALDREGIITFIEGGQAMLNKPDLLGKPIFGLFLDHSDRYLLDRALAGKLNSFVAEYGGRIYEARFSPQVGREDKVIGIYGVAIDITEQKHTERALREGEERNRLLVENAGQPIFTVDYNGIFLTMNNTAAEYMGGRVEDLVGKSMHQLFPPELADEQLASVREAIDTGQKVITEKPTIIRGEERWFITNIQPIKFMGRETSSALLLANDITQRKRLEIREKAKSVFLDNLRKIATINESLKLCCQTIRDSKIFKRVLFAIYMHDEDNRAIAYGQTGMNEESAKQVIEARNPEETLSESISESRFKVSNSYYIAARGDIFEKLEDLNLAKDEQVIGDEGAWHSGDSLFAPLMDEKDRANGWLVADSPFTGRKPSFDDVVFIEELVDAVGKKTREIRYIELLETERTLLREKNITLREVLAHIEEERMEIKNQVAEEVESNIIPLVKKLVKGDGHVSDSQYNVLLQQLESLATPSGSRYLYSKLSPREIEICSLIKAGTSSKDIASELNISLATVQKHRESIRKKLKITNKNINLMTYLRG